ncbi:MAG: hypothetical protein AB7Q00_10315 [Phycisphaerales bacterium]
MSSTVPKDPRAIVAFARVHAERFVEHAAAIGISNEMAAEVAALLAEAEEKLREQVALQSAARSATMAFHEAARRLFERTAGVVRTARAFAETTDNREVYALASIAPPRPRRRVGSTPAAPTSLRADMMAGQGLLRVTWDQPAVEGARQIVYGIQRRVVMADGRTASNAVEMAGGGGEARAADGFVPIATVGERMFIDATVPAGAMRVEYMVTARSGRRVGAASAVLTVRFGGAVGGVVGVVGGHGAGCGVAMPERVVVTNDRATAAA